MRKTTAHEVCASLAILCALLGAVAHPGSEFGPARLGDRCALDAEIVGHPVPPFSDSAHGIVNVYPIGLAGSPQDVRIGYLYTTFGGEAYFVPAEQAFQRGLVIASDSTSVDVGAASAIRASATLPAGTAAGIRSVLKPGANPRFLFLAGQNGPACYSTDWDGRIRK